MRGAISQAHVLNCDETSRKLCPNGIFQWVDTGSQNIAVAIAGNEKESPTVMTAVTFVKTKKPLDVLATGVTERCELTQLGELGGHQADRSATGRMKKQSLLRYLHWPHDELARLHGKEQECDLIMDICPVHIMQSVRNHAALIGTNSTPFQQVSSIPTDHLIEQSSTQ
jgi:hypothetical protein